MVNKFLETGTESVRTLSEKTKKRTTTGRQLLDRGHKGNRRKLRKGEASIECCSGAHRSSELRSNSARPKSRCTVQSDSSRLHLTLHETVEHHSAQHLKRSNATKENA